MKIAHFVSSLSVQTGGPARSVSALASELARRSDASVSLVRSSMLPPDELKIASGLELGILKGKYVRFDERKLYGSDFDVMHSHGLWLPFNHAVAKLAGQHHVLSPRGMLEPWALNNSRMKKKLAWLLYEKCDLRRVWAFHATAHSEAESIRRLGFVQPIAVIPNGVELPEARKLKPAKRSQKKTALFLSRIHPKKGILMLLDAWAKLAPEGWRLVIAGNDDCNHLRVVGARIRSLDLLETVELAGPLFGEDKEAAYRGADLFVLPSYSENFGIVVAEALGYGLPVLTTTGCPWQELSTEGCGWWVEPNPTGVFEGLSGALSTSSETLMAMGARGRRLVEEKYQWPGIAERMAQFYDWLLNGGKQPDFVV
ncbi:glycosyltransferase [Coraliomargarita parva]|uniref:glycosyltransferase n=1 Tax=Coraliomargarita parva TaxID=3014050 RepID=UPI0022B2B0B7|nr:glycosyltransferase [Coraliomargarita parva]